MFATNLSCISCGRSASLDELYKCPACGGVLDVVYNLDALKERQPFRALKGGMARSIWDFRDLLPIESSTAPVSLGEGWTPLTPSIRLGRQLDLNALSFKMESLNPSGSFKDRPISVAISKAVELRVPGVITASSGNAGGAVAAYAARAGLPAIVLVPDGLPSSKLAQIGMYGAELVAVRGTFSGAYQLALRVAEERNWFNITTTYFSAFPTEGNKTAAYELVAQLNDVPDCVLVPVGAGPLLAGMYKGFRELEALGVTARVPRMIAIQAEGCAPVVRAYEAGQAEVVAWEAPETVATGISDPLKGYAEDGSYTLQCVRESGGCAIAVSDEEILASTTALASQEGILVEPTGAVGVAALKSLKERNLIAGNERIVSMITGHGLKDPTSLARIAGDPKVIEPDMSALNAIIGRQ